MRRQQGRLPILAAASAIPAATFTGTSHAAYPGANGRIAFHPSYSPDGTKLLFDRWSLGWDLWIANADGTGTATPPRKDKGKIKESFVSFSPDGTKVVFEGEQKGQIDIWVLDFVDGGSASPRPSIHSSADRRAPKRHETSGRGLT